MDLSTNRRMIGVLLFLLLLCYGIANHPLPDPPQLSMEVVPSVEQYARQRSDQQIEVWQEALTRTLTRITRMEEEQARRASCSIHQASLREGVDPLRITGLLIAESYGDPNAVSPAGALGLMQVIPPTGEFIAYHRGERWRGTPSLHEIETSIEYGAWYYRHLVRRFEGNEAAALAAYNWGPGYIARRLGNDRGLPRVYPELVLKAQQRAEAVLSEEYWKLHRHPDYKKDPDQKICLDPEPGPRAVAVHRS